MSAIILFRSLTYAQRGVHILQAGGVPATVVKAPPETTDRGCTYAAGLSIRYLRRALAILDGRGIVHGRAFVPGPEGVYREAAP